MNQQKTAFQKIVEWNEKRGLIKPYRIENEMAFIIEEVIEVMTNLKSEEAREYSKAISNAIRNGYLDKVVDFIKENEYDSEPVEEEINENNIIDGCADMIVFATGTIRKTGYDPDIVMEETQKEIDSRVGKMIGGKFVKDKSLEAQKNWYKANYNNALL